MAGGPDAGARRGAGALAARRDRASLRWGDYRRRAENYKSRQIHAVTSVVHVGDHVTLFAIVAQRSPIRGYNHNISYRGLVFHVQTEDSGVTNPHIFTHLFHGGVILSTRKLEYDAEASEEAVKSLMQAQHKAALKELKRGEFDDKIDAYLGDNPDLQPRGSGAVTVETPARGMPVPAAQPGSERAGDSAARRASSPVSAAFQAMSPSRKTGELAPVPAPATKKKGARRFPTPIPQAPPPVVDPDRQRPVIESRTAPRGDATVPRVRSQPPPSTKPGPRRQSSKAKVVISKPPIVVASGKGGSPRTPPRRSTPPPIPPHPRKSQHTTRAPSVPPPPRRPTARTVRDDPGDAMYDQNLISEKSLDEVILAYLSEDNPDE